MKFTVRGIIWKLRHSCRIKRDWGYCDDAAKEIVLYSKMRPKKELEIALHEFLHAYFPDADEKVVDQFGKDACEYLWRQGYRK